jgi:hypothetical protein
MIAVAVVGVVLGLFLLVKRREDEFRRQAVHHTNELAGCYAPEGLTTAQVGAILRRRDYHRAMMIKYERAARYPWLPVAPDPPEPK